MQSKSAFVRNFVETQTTFKPQITYQKDTDSSPNQNPFFKNWKFWVLVIALVSTAIVAGLRYEDVVEYGKEGKPQIKTKRLERLADTIRYYEGAEQYALIARVPKYYHCPSCMDGDSIFLFKGEVWKYGVTINGQSGRYNELPDPKLQYQIQFKGSLARCKSEEQVKIVNYPILPENQKRKPNEKLA